MKQRNTRVSDRNELIFKELLAVMTLAALLLILALAFPAGSDIMGGSSADQGSNVRAPWLLIWLQVLLRTFPPWFAGMVLPFTLFGLLILLPWLPGSTANNRPFRCLVHPHLLLFFLMVCILLAITLAGL